MKYNENAIVGKKSNREFENVQKIANINRKSKKKYYVKNNCL